MTLRLSDLPDLLDVSSVRVQIDRESIRRFNPTVSVEVRSARAWGARLLPPWYFRSRERSSFDDPGAVQHSLSEIAMLRLMQPLGAGLPNVPFAVPTYGLPGGRELVLDGNHRLLELMIRAPRATIVAVSVRGPLDAELLPDLGRWHPFGSADEG